MDEDEALSWFKKKPRTARTYTQKNVLIGVPWTIMTNIGTEENPKAQMQFYGWSVHKTQKDAKAFICERAMEEPKKYTVNGSLGIKSRLNGPFKMGMIMNAADTYENVEYSDEIKEDLVLGFLTNPKGIMFPEWCPAGLDNKHIQSLRDLRELDTK